MLLGHVGSNVEAASFDESIINNRSLQTPHLDGSPQQDDKLQGIALIPTKQDVNSVFRRSCLAVANHLSNQQELE